MCPVRCKDPRNGLIGSLNFWAALLLLSPCCVTIMCWSGSHLAFCLRWKCGSIAFTLSSRGCLHMLVVAASLKVARITLYISIWATNLNRGLHSLRSRGSSIHGNGAISLSRGPPEYAAFTESTGGGLGEEHPKAWAGLVRVQPFASAASGISCMEHKKSILQRKDVSVSLEVMRYLSSRIGGVRRRSTWSRY
jgi:hypothetical protein